jgi:Zn-dependent M28 family amino/carboxypeptidase
LDLTMRRLFSLLLLALPAVLTGQSPTTAATRLARAVDANVYRAHLDFLADDALEGRAPATRGGILAARNNAAQFQRLGLEPGGDSGTYFHNVPVIALVADPALATTGARPVTLRNRDDFVLYSMRNDERVELKADAVFAGYGIVAPEEGWDDYAGVDVKGKYVFVLVNDPGLHDPAIFRGKILTYYGRWTYKIEEAARQGAAGIILVHTTENATYPWSTVTASWSGEQVRPEKPATSLVVAGWMRDAVVGSLFSANGADLAALTARAGKKGFRAVPLSFGISSTIRSTLRRSSTSNVIGRLKGRGRLAAEQIIIGGHYDHLGIGSPVKGDSIYNGAEDNASGTAGVLTAAEAFVRSGVEPQRSIMFVAFGAEEKGLLGSEALTERPPVPLKQIAAVLNMDVMNLYGRMKDISALGLDQSSIGPVFSTAALAEGLKVGVDSSALIRGSFFRSDHFPFAKAGIPSISVERGHVFEGKPEKWGEEQEEEYNENRYHQPQDEILPWFNMDGAVQQLRVILRTAIALANAPAQPTWSAGSEFRATGEARLK